MSPDGATDRLLELLRARSFARKKVVLASGKESDFFVDCKQTVLLAEGHALVADAMLAALATPTFGHVDAVAGVELGGCPLASAVALRSFQRGTPKDALYVRKEAKDHGSRRLVEGDTHLAKGARIALLEDVVTTGGSTLRAADRLRDAGYVVAGVVAIVDRSEGGREAIEATGVPVVALYRRADFIPI
ncbi:MAG: orotate phosphoribosyltransferase [Polyangiaceae bacterium]